MEDLEREQYIQQLKSEAMRLQERNLELTGNLSSSSFTSKSDPNIIQYQLETGSLLANIEHYIKGDELIIDQEGNQYYKKQENPDLILFNEYGANLIMQTIGQYIDKNTFLSYYTEERINEILADIGDELSDVLFCNYERMGLTTEFKKSRYKLIVVTILHMCESAYRRAIAGKEREEINASRIYTNNDSLRMSNNFSMPKKKFNLLSPKTW